MNTREPVSEAPTKLARGLPFPPVGPIEWMVVVPPERSYTSCEASVSAATSDSSVLKKTFEPSAEAPSKVAGRFAFAPRSAPLTAAWWCHRSARRRPASCRCRRRPGTRWSRRTPSARCSRCPSARRPRRRCRRWGRSRQRGRPARALVDVERRVGVGADQRLARGDEDVRACLVGRGQIRVQRRVAPRGPGRDERRVPAARRYTSREPSVSAAASCSSVWKTTACPASTAAPKFTGKAPLPPVGPVETSVVPLPVRSYTSSDESLSELTSGSAVRMNDRFPTLEGADQLGALGRRCLRRARSTRATASCAGRDPSRAARRPPRQGRPRALRPRPAASMIPVRASPCPL